MRKRWILKKADEEVRRLLVRELGISPIIAQLLANRNIIDPGEVDRFLNCSLSNLHDPFMLRGMDKAVSRIKHALSKGEKIMVYGDYDVDGITSVALLKSVLHDLGGNIFEYIPNRLEEGYGLNLKACQLAYRKGITLLVTVDCGINARSQVAYLNSLGVDVVIVDHHEPQLDNLPDACAVVNPLQENCPYPFKHLASVGLVFKLAQAILGCGPEKIKDLLDLVALGTVADVAPQLGENRILTKYGLEILSTTKRTGLKELIRVSGLTGKDISSGHIGYILGPRINASGRIGSPKMALRLLLTKRPDEAKELAEMLDKANRNRQRIESDILQEAIQKIKTEINFKEHNTIVLSGSDWHAGVIGIVASKIVDRFYRPTVIISLKSDTGRASARSISGFNLFDAISKCKRYLSEFGGHEAACGFTIHRENVEKFKELFNKSAKNLLGPEDLLPKLNVDIDIPLGELSESLIYEMKKLAPHGPKNPSPVFISRGIKLKNIPKTIGRNGVKFWVTDDSITCEAVAFGVSNAFFDMLKKERVDLAYSPSINNYRGMKSIRLNLEDLKASETAC